MRIPISRDSHRWRPHIVISLIPEIESTAAITAHIFSILVAKFSKDNFIKPEVIAYMRLLIDQMLEKTKKVEYGAKRDRAEDGGSASGKAASGTLLRDPTGLGFKLTPENDYDMENRRLVNVMDPANLNDVFNLKYYLSSRNYFGGSRLLEVGTPSIKMDATNKAYVDSAIRDSETSMRTYMDMLP
ncbi:hypothetical protein FQA39_LY15587 [Lamprigera yunnana]|nr:hypothetical protein FQA39_LY15587 [Lamprigera yunnana]